VKIVVPPAFGDLFYGLRGHISAVRESLLSENTFTSIPSAANDPVKDAGPQSSR